MRRRRAGPRQFALRLAVLVLVTAMTGCGTATDDTPTTVGATTAAADPPVAPGAVWPSRDETALMALQDLTDRGRRPDLLDPVVVARQYAATAIPGAPAIAATGVPVAGPFAPTGPTTGEVQIAGNGLAPSTVYLRRLDRDPRDAMPAGGPSIWYVQGVGSSVLGVVDVDYDGQRLVASFIPSSGGTVSVRVTGLDESLLFEQTMPAQENHLVPIDIEAPSQPGLVVSATLAVPDGSIAPREFRIGPPAPGS
jgi:hypothetical protein